MHVCGPFSYVFTHIPILCTIHELSVSYCHLMYVIMRRDRSYVSSLEYSVNMIGHNYEQEKKVCRYLSRCTIKHLLGAK